MTRPVWRQPLVVLVLATFVIFISYGTRQSFGLFLRPITMDMGWGREALSFALATQSLMIGISAPFVAAIADRWNPVIVVVASGVLYTIGLFFMSQAMTPGGMVVSVGLIAGVAAAGCGLPLMLAVVGRIAPEHRRSLWLGITTAGGTAGQFLLVPACQWLISTFGWGSALLVLAAGVFMIVPFGGAIAKAGGDSFKSRDPQSLGQALREASRHRGYWLLLTGFFVCGFQVQFIIMHLPAYLADVSAGVGMGAAAIALIGLFNMIGTSTAGYLGGKHRKKYLLSLLYFGRSLVLLAFFVLPVSQLSVVLFASVIGLLWLATVPLTAGIVAQIFGTRYMATLYAFVFLSHQLGSFLSVWLGGRLFDTTGSYDIVWWAIIVAGFAASLIHWPIDDHPVARLAEQQA
jgi:MFS family permease